MFYGNINKWGKKLYVLKMGFLYNLYTFTLSIYKRRAQQKYSF